MMERYNQLYCDLKLLIEMKKDFDEDEEMLEYIEFKMKEIENELQQIDNVWFNDEI